MRQILRPNTLLCFSPPVMIATVIIELALAVWVLTRYAIRRPQQLIVALLLVLAAFQWAEFNVCGSALPDLIWSRLGYVFITFLPALGIHLAVRLRGEHRRGLLTLSYGTAAAFAVGFGLAPTGLNQGVCTGNYVIFALSQPLAQIYAIYYYALEAIGLALAWLPAPHTTVPHRQAARWLGLGYLIFIIPTFVILLILPAAHVGIPSIMCGFAVLLALVLGLKVAPLASR